MEVLVDDFADTEKLGDNTVEGSALSLLLIPENQGIDPGLHLRNGIVLYPGQLHIVGVTPAAHPPPPNCLRNFRGLYEHLEARPNAT